MIRGTTPTHKFILPLGADSISKFKVIYAQNDTVILTKENGSCQCEGNEISVRLTQAETLLFDCKKPVQIQLRILTIDGDALASNITLVGVDKCLESEVLE